MHHQTSLIATIVIGLGLAFLFGMVAQRLRMSPLVGYLLAGVAVGPFTPGFVANQGLAPQLAEIGVILLMFGVGLHFSLKDLLSVKAIAVPGALAQISFVTALGTLAGWIMGWPIAGGVVFGLALSVASTVVVLRVLADRRLVETEKGRIAIGWLVVEDLAMVLALVLLPSIAGLAGGGTADPVSPDARDLATYLGIQPGIGLTIGLTLVKLAGFVAAMMLIGRKVIPWLLHYVARTGSRELFRLSVLAIALGTAFGSAQLFGVSFALGAFFAGMILSETELSHQAAEETLPLRDAFAVLFFVSVGMLFNPAILLEQPLPVLSTFLIVVLGNMAIAFVVVRVCGYGVGTGLVLAAALAQIGEFSFILGGLGVSLGVLPAAGNDLILAAAILSILVNPALFFLIDRYRSKSAKAPVDAETRPAIVPTHLTGHAVLVGHGRVGSLVAATLAERGVPFLVIEERQEIVDGLRAHGIEAILGNAAEPGVLAAANRKSAKFFISAIPHPFENGNLLDDAKASNPELTIVARAHSEREVDYLRDHGASLVVMGEREIARAISEHIVGKLEREPGSGWDSEKTDAFVAAQAEPAT